MKTTMTIIYPVLAMFAFACFALAPLTQAAPPPKPEDRGNGNSAAENVSALSLGTTGTDNTAHGWFSLFNNTTGSFNTADGFQALFSNTTGNFNTANGYQALQSNTEGGSNTAIGRNALQSNTTGDGNTASGDRALQSNTTGIFNTASGFQALQSNNNGIFNTATGYQALQSNTEGGSNSAIGRSALKSNTTGNNNTADGSSALQNNTEGSGNIALGAGAGGEITTANNVTCIGSGIGANVSNTTWIRNIYGVTTQGGTTAPVVVSDAGQLGTVASSERFKKDIATMNSASEAILSLRPVTFHYKSDAKDTPQFGLIAEEVAEVNPALVLPDKEGKPYTVRYDAVNAMLLNEFLKEHATVQQLKKEVAALTAGLQRVNAQLEMNKPAPQTALNTQ